MNKKTCSAAFAVTMLLASLMVGSHFVKGVDNVSMSFAGGVTLYSPINTTYDSNFLTLNISFLCALGVHASLNYSLDNAPMQGPIPLVFNSSVFDLFEPGLGSVQLPELSYGSHSLTITEQALLPDWHGANPPGAPFEPTYPGSSDYVAYWIDTVDFFVSSSWTQPPAPNVTILSLENQTYNATDVPLTFAVDQNISKASYCLDGEDNVTVAENRTLSGLAVGAHNVTIYVWNDAGHVGASRTVNFTVTNTPSAAAKSPQASSLLLVMVSVAMLTVLFVGFLVYWKISSKRQPNVKKILATDAP